MSNFKYSANIDGTIENKERFIKDLQNRGYTLKIGGATNSYPLAVNNCSFSNLKNSEYWYADKVKDRDYNFFNIDTDKEYNTALAILSIKDDELFYTGELIEIIAAGKWGYSYANNGCIGIVIETNQEIPSLRVCTEANQNIVFRTLNSKDSYSCYVEKADAPNLAYSKPVFRKLTPEEIINFYKNQNMKELLGYKLKEDCKQFEIAALKIIGCSKFEVQPQGYNFVINGNIYNGLKDANVLDLWFEPVYKTTSSDKIYILESRDEVRVYKNGFVKYSSFEPFTVQNLQETYAKYIGKGKIRKFKEWDITVDEFKITIHCPGHYHSGVKVTSKDLKGIVDTWKELNSYCS